MNNTTNVNYEQILENLPFISVRFSYDGSPRKIQTITRNIEQMGFRREKLLAPGVSWADIIHPDDRLLTLRLGQDYLTKKRSSFRLDYRLVNPMGEVFWIKEYSHVTFTADGGVESIDTMLLRLADDSPDATNTSVDISQYIVLSEILLNLQDANTDDSLKLIFEYAAGHINPGRILLFEENDADGSCKAVYEWHGPGVPSMSELAEQNSWYNYERGIPELNRALRGKGMLVINSEEMPADFKALLSPHGVTALAAFSVYRLGQHYGSMVFSDYMQERQWDHSSIDFLKNISRLVSTVLARMQAEEKLLLTKKTCETVLDNIDSYIYAVHTETNAIIFANHSFRCVFGVDCVGKNADDFICLGAANQVNRKEAQEINSFVAETSSCYSDLRLDSTFYEVYLEKQAQWLSICKESTPWVNGQMAYLVYCYDNTAHKNAENEIRRQAYTDYLTGLPNRYHCDETLTRMMVEMKNVKASAYLFFIDLDDFKIVNDSFGHDYGDGVLKSFSDFLKETYNGKNRVFRLGGDEFVVIVAPENGLNVPEYLENMLERARHPWKALDKEFYCSLSIGVVEFIARLEDARSILKKADIAMYAAKKMGKNNYVYYVEELDLDVLNRSEKETALRLSIKNDFSGFELLYQPYYNLKNSAISGAEALIRMNGEDGELIPPAQFIPLAEYLGLIIPMGEFALRKSAELCKQINDSGLGSFSITVNFSAAQFKQTRLVERVAETLAETGVDTRNMIIAINEAVAMDERSIMLSHCEALHKLGLRVVMDDFGAGNASFINLRELPVDSIKISPQYLYAHNDEFTASFIELVTRLGHATGKSICVSRVETEEQMAFCRKLDIDMAQGFLLHKPISSQDLLKLLKKNR